MTERDTRLERAREYLLIQDGNDRKDAIVWEHVRRVCHCAMALTRLPEVQADQIEPEALEVAALFHDAGWVAQYRQGRCSRLAVLGRPTSDIQRDLAVTVMEEVLRDSAPPGVLDRAGRIIRTYNTPEPAEYEARLLIEADRLDEVGPLALLRLWRRFCAQGQCTSDLVKTWSQQQEYRFWEARLNEFCFEATRTLAERRLEVIEPFMQAMAQHHRGQDIKETIEQLLSPAEGTLTAPPLPELDWPNERR
jgi:hypothetical protein